MAYNYLRYAIVGPHLQLFNHQIKGTLSLKQQRLCLCQRQVMPERPSSRYKSLFLLKPSLLLCLLFV